jgi:Caspase domain
MSAQRACSLPAGLRRGALLLGLLAAGTAVAADLPPGAERQTRHALVIGIGQYTDPEIPRLRGTPLDIASARRMAAAMAIAPANITVLRDQDATAERIRAEITALNGRVRDGDRVFVYYSGHGTRWYDERATGGGCTEGLMASDGQVLTNVELGQRLAPLARRADKMLVFYDACFSGGVAGAPFRTRSVSLQGEQITPKFTRAGAPEACAQPSNFRTRSLAQVMQQAQALPQNVVHIAASRPDEASFDSSTVGGFATSAWRDCLLGQAQDLDGSGAITADEVTRCAQARIDTALAGQPGILGQRMTVAGNAGFVPAWMGATARAVSSPACASR